MAQAHRSAPARLDGGPVAGPRRRPGTGTGRPGGGRMLARCPDTPGTRTCSPVGGSPVWRALARPGGMTWLGQEEAVEMDVEHLLARASENLSVRRAFGAAYEKDGMLIIPVALVAGGGGGGTSMARSRRTDPAAGPGSPPGEGPTGH